MPIHRNLRKPREIYQKEQKEFFHGQINKIRNSVEDRQSQIAWHIINEMRKSKSTSRAKLKTVRQEERIQKWKEHFLNTLRNSPKVTDKTIEKCTKACILPFPKKGDLRITKNNWGITLTSITIEKILWKNQNGFQRNSDNLLKHQRSMHKKISRQYSCL